MKKVFTVVLFAVTLNGYGQTISLPATTIPYDPATHTASIPPTVITVTPAATPPPITIAALLNLGLDIVSVEYKAGVHEIVGYNSTGVLVTNKVLFGLGNVLAVSNFTKPKIAIITVPFKVRGAVDTVSSKAQAGLTNIGLSFNLVNYRMDRYFSTGTKSTHTLSGGFFVAPNVEEVTPETTRKLVKAKSSQLFISTGLAFTYSYGDVSFLVVPAAFDFGTTESAKKYIYNGKYWWGFGIGISTKLFGII
jgi:hypothetical protein